MQLHQLEEDRAPPADRRGVIEHAGLSVQQRLLELDVLAEVEEGAGAGRVDPLGDRLGDVVDDVTDVVNWAMIHRQGPIMP